MKQDQVRTLIRAHYDRDEHRFALTVKQIAAQLKDKELADLLVTQTMRALEVPAEAKSLLVQAAPVDVADLILPESVSQLLTEVAREHRQSVALSARNLAPRSRLLFSGPSGNGKTSAASALAGMLGLTPYVASLSALVSSHLGETGKSITNMFAALRAGHALTIDEIDAVGSARAGTIAADKERNQSVNVLLTELDRCATGLLVATTNRADMLDPALLRRFDEVVEFPAPTGVQLDELGARLRAKYGLPPGGIVWDYEVNNFDAATKAVKREARAAVLAELERAEVA